MDKGKKAPEESMLSVDVKISSLKDRLKIPRLQWAGKKRFILLPVSEGGMNLKTTDMKRLIEIMGIRSLAQ
ncbi:MAG: hypothetical protein MUC41_14895 [Syntrophobacteraceae bacterium]|nr:hypothetical protein [Syntrophobacteraceae bacterium]